MRTAIALGANKGTALLAQLTRARDLLRPFHHGDDTDFLVSPVYKTPPVSCPPGSPDFYNAVIELEWNKPPERLLSILQSIEHYMGRTRNGILNESRVIDLDLLYYGDFFVHTETLTLPHPRLSKRAFVLKPLADIVPNMVIPGTNRPVSDLLRALPPSDLDALSLVTDTW